MLHIPSLGGFPFTLFMTAWWIVVLNFNEVIYINHLFEFIKTISLKVLKLCISYLILGPSEIAFWIWHTLGRHFRSNAPPLPNKYPYLSVDNFWIDPMIYKTTSVLYSSYINAWIQIPDFPLFCKRQYVYSVLIWHGFNYHSFLICYMICTSPCLGLFFSILACLYTLL